MTNAQELESLLKKFNKGVKRVAIESGIVCVEVSSSHAAFGVKLDLLRSRGFRSVTTCPNAAAGRGFLVHGVVA